MLVLVDGFLSLIIKIFECVSEDFSKYCQELCDTTVWGGQLEVCLKYSIVRTYMTAHVLFWGYL